MKKNLWSSWSEYLNVSNTDTLEEFSETLVPQTKSDVMKLQLKDMNLFGYCSEYDDFYVVICEICGKSIKPQSLNLHVEFRHRNINLHKFSFPGSAQETSLLTCIAPNSSKEMSRNEDKLSNINSKILTKDKIIMGNKRHSVKVQPYPKPSSINSYQERNVGELTTYSPSSDMVKATLTRSIRSENHESLKNVCVRKMSSPESSLSTSDSETSMTAFLHHSPLMPNIKLCDIKDQSSDHLLCPSSKALPKSNCLSKTTVLTQVFPEKRVGQSIQSPKQDSQVHHQEVADWNSVQNSTNLGLNGMPYAACNQHSSHFCPLMVYQWVRVKSEEMNSHSFNCSDVKKKFGDLESQVLIHNAAVGT